MYASVLLLDEDYNIIMLSESLPIKKNVIKNDSGFMDSRFEEEIAVVAIVAVIVFC